MKLKQVVNREPNALVTTLTKRMLKTLPSICGNGYKSEYLHSDVDAIERVEILRNLRAGAYDVIVGVNLLRRA